MQPTPRFSPVRTTLGDSTVTVEGNARVALQKKYRTAKERLKEMLADKDIDVQSLIVDAPIGTELGDAQLLLKQMIMFSWALDRGHKAGWERITGQQRAKAELGKVLGHFDIKEPAMDPNAMGENPADEQLNNGGM